MFSSQEGAMELGNDSFKERDQLFQQWTSLIDKAVESLTTSQGDRFRLGRFHQRLTETLDQIETMRGRHILNDFQAEGLSDIINKVLVTLARSMDRAVDSTVTAILRPIHRASPTLQGGRPRFHIDINYLSQAIDQLNMGPSEIARNLNEGRPLAEHVHPRTIRRRILEAGLRLEDEPTVRYSTISDADLDPIIVRLRKDHPKVGAPYLHGELSSLGHYLPRDRVRDACARLRPIRHLLQDNMFPTRNVYSVAGPNSVWHNDGQHELILFGIVVHTFCDGFSRLVPCIRASTNNRADTVLDVFLEGVGQYGLPSRCRGDRGGENVKVAYYMDEIRGSHRGSYLWGVSPHNTRIERLWPEVVRLVLEKWYDHFMRLQAEYYYDRGLDRHKWLGGYLYLGDINAGLQRFRNTHNKHRVQSARYQTPEQMMFEGMVVNGVRGFWDKPGILSLDGEHVVDEERYGVELDEEELTERLQELGEDMPGSRRGARIEDQVNGQVDLEDARCPFVDVRAGIAAMDALMEGKWGGDDDLVERWLAGLEAMESILEVEN
ncbi:hypothetical protein P7C70_g8600, partial [Phenoliferia sp. Uapishka_3]